MRFAIAAVVALLLLQSPTYAESAKPSGLTNLLSAQAGRFVGPGGAYRAGIYVKSLATGEAASVRGDEHFNSASTIKIAVMVMAFQMADRGQLNLDERYTIKTSDIRGGSGTFRFQRTGASLTLRDIITYMIIVSDNTATDIMIEKVGGKGAVNAWFKNNGYLTTRLQNTLYTMFRLDFELIDPKYKSLSPEDVYALDPDTLDPAILAPRKELIARINAEGKARQIEEEWRKASFREDYWLGVISPNEMGRLVESIQQNTAASVASCEEMKRILRATLDDRKIRHFLDAPVAHKSGTDRGVANEAGIVYARSGPIVMAFYTGGYTGLSGDVDDRIGKVARLVVDYFDGER